MRSVFMAAINAKKGSKMHGRALDERGFSEGLDRQDYEARGANLEEKSTANICCVDVGKRETGNVR